MGPLLKRRVAERPGDASAWRLLGHWHLGRGEAEEALGSLDRAVALDPKSVAAQLDRAKALIAMGRAELAREPLAVVLDLAPESEHGLEAGALMTTLPPGGDGPVKRASYEVRRFDGTTPEDRDPIEKQQFGRLLDGGTLTPPVGPQPLPRYSLTLETGVLYDTNVALSPSSRELSPGNLKSAQAFFAPELEYRVFNTPTWRAGATFGGNFTVNEDHVRQFNLQSFRPGAFLERDVLWGETLLVPRLQYDFGYDLFDFDPFATRHSLTGSVIAIEPTGHTWLASLSGDVTDFQDDGSTPAVTSQDGVAANLLLSRDWRVGMLHFQSFRLGVSAQRADTTGTDYRFQGVSLISKAKFPITAQHLAIVSGSVGYRDYYDYQFDPPRDEVVLRLGVEHRWLFSRNAWLSFVAKYDRFDSDSPLFTSDKILGGVTFTYQR